MTGAAAPTRGRVVGLALAICGVLAVIALQLPVPYVVLSPNQPDNTLGLGADGRPVISFGPGAPAASATTGALELTTVLQSTGTLRLWGALQAWADSAQAVVPLAAVQQPGQSEQAVRRQDVAEMAQSRNSATTAAFAYLHLLTVSVSTAGVPGLPKGTKVTAVTVTPPGGGAPTTRPLASAAQFAALAGSCPAGTVLSLAGPGGPVPVLTCGGGHTPSVTLTDTAPFTVTINLVDVGGPSAGLEFALGIIDKLTPGGNLTGGHTLAGTGTISDTGDVGPIGGVQQKIIGAHRLGHAEFFFVPSDNCTEAAATGVSGIRLVRVHSLDDALASLAMIRAGRVDALPRC